MADRAVNLHEARKSRPTPFQSGTFADFDGRDVPQVKWLIPGVLVKGGVTLFSGQGGKGKSLLVMQLQAAAATCQDWLGMPTQAEPVPSFALYCEDEADVLHGRMDAIRKHYGVNWADLEPCRFVSRVGYNNELMRFWGRNREEGEATALLQQVREEVVNWGARIVIIDTVADTFGGNENIRSQVRTFVNALRALVLPVGGGVILNAHPSRAGLSDGSGLSGSTAWEASVRARINLTEPKKQDSDDDAEQEPTRERILKVMKSNYGPAGQRWRLLWDDGVFIRADAKSTSQMERLDAKNKLLAAARYYVSRGFHLSSLHGTKASLTAKAVELPSCKDIAFSALKWAQEKLEEEGQLVPVDIGPQSRRRRYIRPSDMVYPDEIVTAGEPT